MSAHTLKDLNQLALINSKVKMEKTILKAKIETLEFCINEFQEELEFNHGNSGLELYSDAYYNLSERITYLQRKKEELEKDL